MDRRGQLFLFGSRTDDKKKGGDIDLYLLLESQSDVETLKTSKTKISYDIQGLIGEQKIDITINSKNEITDDVFWNSIQNELLLLQKW